MRARGQPFRFLALVVVFWVGVRVALLWPAGSLPEAIRPLASLPAIDTPVTDATPDGIVSHTIRKKRRVAAPRALSAPAFASVAARDMPSAPRIADGMAAEMRARADPHRAARQDRSPSPPAPDAAPAPAWPHPSPDRWSASGWIVARAASGTGTAPGGGQLGGAQAGVRIAFNAVPGARIAAFARLTTPLAGKGREAAIGIEWRPGRAPLRIVAEQRVGIDGAPGGTGIGMIAGMDQSVHGVRIEAYGQAGAVLRSRTELYADGAMRVSSSLRNVHAPVSLGIGAWGGAQRGAQRLDIGPSVTVTAKSVRISLDWRQRIVGRARPGSGLALSIGGDF